MTARSDLQKIRYSLRENANVLSSMLVDFRRLIRGVHGSTSKEYHSIKAFYGRNPEVTDEPVETSDSEDQSTQDGPSSDMQLAGPAGTIDQDDPAPPVQPASPAGPARPLDEDQPNMPITCDDKARVA